MAWLHVVVALYGLLNIVVGAMGFSKSPVSLYAGAGAGVLVFVGLFLARSKPTIGYGLVAVVCLALLGRFVPAYLKSGDPWPAGVIAAASVVTLIALVVGHFMKPSA